MRGLVFGAFIIIPLIANTAQAAEINTYRPGQPYQKIAAGDYRQCEAQCKGDAACRGWNFVRPNINAKSGICEFNSRFAAPVLSPLSISAEIRTSVDNVLSRAVPSKSANTIRIGTPIVARAKPANPRQKTARKIIRKPLPFAQRPTKAIHKTPKPAIMQNRRAQNQNNKKLLTRLSREQVYKRHLLAAQRRATQNMDLSARNNQNLMPRPGKQIPDSRQNLPASQNFAQKQITNTAKAPKMSQAMQRTMQQTMQQTMPAPAIPQSYPQIGQKADNSLYGSLYDDLTKLTPVPRPETAPDNPDDPDAPISTVRPAPTTPITVTPVKNETLIPAGLAGG